MQRERLLLPRLPGLQHAPHYHLHLLRNHDQKGNAVFSVNQQQQLYRRLIIGS